MTLLKQLSDVLAKKELEVQRKSMRIKGDDVPLHQVITGSGALEQAAEYSRELIARGFLKNAPVRFDCHQPTSDHMVQQVFEEAKGGMLLVYNIDHLARHESFVSLATQAHEKNRCIMVICGPKQAMDVLFAGEPDFGAGFPPRIDMDSAEAKVELAEHQEQEKAAAVESATVVQTPLQPMKPLTFKKP